MARLSAFSLLELLIVISIIATLAALLLPALSSARERARAVQCTSNMRQFGMAFRFYQDDHSGMYPDPWVDNQQNWHSFLGNPTYGGKYLPSNWVQYSATYFSYRIVGKFLCPTTVMQNQIPIDAGHNQWGYCLNLTRTEISYGAGGWPWFLSQYQNASLDALYSRVSKYAVMTDGNQTSWNSDNDWDATTSINPNDCAVRAVHGDVANTLFMDGHVEAMKFGSAADRTAFNRAWYGGIPVFGGGNPYSND